MAAGTPRRRRLLRLRGETRPGINSFCEKIRSNMNSHGSIFSFDNLLAAAAATAMLLPSACSEDPMADNAFSGPMLRFEVVDRHGWQTPSQSRAAGDITVDATDSTTLLHPDIFILRGGGNFRLPIRSSCMRRLPTVSNRVSRTSKSFRPVPRPSERTLSTNRSACWRRPIPDRGAKLLA